MKNKRILAFMIDFVLFVVIQWIVKLLFDAYYINMLLWSFFFCRDGFTGQGLGKRLMGIMVTYKQVVADPLRCSIRSVFCLLWFVELIMLFINNGRRVGDIVTGCNVTTGCGDKFNANNIIPCVIIFVILCSFYTAYVKYSSVYLLMNTI